MKGNPFDVIVVGAGAAGLMAAWELARTGKIVAVVEGRERAGGRIHTISDHGFDLPVERGAEFIHGDLPLTQMILEKAGIQYYETTGEFWQKDKGRFHQQDDLIEDFSQLEKKFSELKQDLPVAGFLDQYLQEEGLEDLQKTLRTYVEGYYAGDIQKTSTFALRDELMNSDDVQYRIEGGYTQMIEWLQEQCEKAGVHFYFSAPVKEILWQHNEVTVRCEGMQLQGRKSIVTVPVGVLQTEQILFSPALPEKMAAARQLGFGPVVKSILQFKHAFWKDRQHTGEDLDQLGFVFSEAVIPTWWTYYPKNANMLTGWSGGLHAMAIHDLSSAQIVEKGLESLSSIFSMPFRELKDQLKASHVANWVQDPFCGGAYSYEVVNGAAFIGSIKRPVEETLYFAGEGLYHGPEIGTVEAALHSGREAAHLLISKF